MSPVQRLLANRVTVLFEGKRSAQVKGLVGEEKEARYQTVQKSTPGRVRRNLIGPWHELVAIILYDVTCTIRPI